MSQRPNISIVLACAAILAAGIAVYSDSFNGPFIFDDINSIRDNATLRHSPAWENFVPPRENPLFRRPAVNFTFAFNHAIGGLDVRGYHAGNLLIHLLSALLLFGLVRRTLLAMRWQTVPPSVAAFSVALIWSIHPLLTESVSYLTQRTELLMGLFFLLTLYCAIRGASSAHAWRWNAASVAACALGMGSKEVMVSAPILVLLYDRCFLSGSFREALRRRRAFYIGLAATWAVFGALLIAFPVRDQPGGFSANVGPWEYARTQPGVILHYLRLSFWPWPLCVDYGWPIATSAWRIVPAGLAVVALLAGSLWALRRAPSAPSSGAGRRALGFLGAWFFLILAPTSSFMPIVTEVAAERRMYLPLAAVTAGAVLAAIWCWNRTWPLASNRGSGRALVGAGILAVAVLGFLTVGRNAEYRDAVALWRQTVRVAPQSARAHCNLGSLIARALAADPDAAGLSYEESLHEMDQAIALDPGDADAYYYRGNILVDNHRYAEAIRDYGRSIALNPGRAQAFCNRGIAYAKAGRRQEALRDFDQAILLDPDNALAYVSRGNIHAAAQRSAEAIRDYDRAIALKPDCAEAYYNRGNIRLDARRFDEAIRDFDQAIALRPDYADAWFNRANAYVADGRPAEAIRDYSRAIELRPNDRDAWYNRGMVRKGLKQNSEALADFQMARKLGATVPEEFLRSGR